MKRTFSLIVLMAVMCSCLAMTAHAADYPPHSSLII